MATTKLLPVKELRLDLKNFRTVSQKDELSALHTMISINPDRFWALTESLLETGYLPTENIIVLKDKKGVLHVREGNRRIGALKLAFKYLNSAGLSIPKRVEDMLKEINADWKKTNGDVPCAIYEEKDETLVDKIVALAHGKGEQAGRDSWSTVARARHNRDKNGASEIGLDLLEKYLTSGKNLTSHEKDLWSGLYPLTVLNEVVGKIAPRFGYSSSRDLVENYPVKFRTELENILKDIGNERLKFETIRDKSNDFAAVYGIPTSSTSVKAGTKATIPTAGGVGANTSSGTTAMGPRAIASTDPRSVIRALKTFAPRGKGRAKLVTLLEEARHLKLDKTPHAFCFVLRAIFEVSAKAYCTDHVASGLTLVDKKTGKDKTLASVLQEIVNHMTANKPRTDPLCKELHGAMTELGKANGLLSVTSMNQLIHSTSFVVDETHICTVFSNVFPLLREMNS
jgi:hypothetical protein